jgi:hypothetical protein
VPPAARIGDRTRITAGVARRIGAHHICSGLGVVGRVTKRTAEEIDREDIAPFPRLQLGPELHVRRR